MFGADGQEQVGGVFDLEALGVDSVVELESGVESGADVGGLAHVAGRKGHSFLCLLYGLLWSQLGRGAVKLIDATEGVDEVVLQGLHCFVVLGYVAVAGMGDEFGGAESPDLAGVEGGAAGSFDAVGAGHFAYDEDAGYVGLPPGVDGEAAVVVLGADGDFEGFLIEVDAVFFVDVDGEWIHVGEAFYGQLLLGAGVFEVGAGLGFEVVELEGCHGVSADGVATEVEEDASAFLHFVEHQDVNEGGLAIGDALCVEWPLVSLEEDGAGHITHGGEEVAEEVAFVASIRVGAEETWYDLHVGAGDVPSELGAGQAEL